MLYEYKLDTPRQNFYNITGQVRGAIADSGITSGLAVVYCPHTTAGITINENADPDVVRDMLYALDKTCPDRPEFRHSEGGGAPPGGLPPGAHDRESTERSEVETLRRGY